MGIGLDGINPNADVNSKGIVPRSISVIFERLAQQKDQDPDFQSSVTVSFMELYNEELIDLLNPRSDKPLVIREDAGKIFVENVGEEEVGTEEKLLKFVGFM